MSFFQNQKKNRSSREPFLNETVLTEINDASSGVPGNKDFDSQKIFNNIFSVGSSEVIVRAIAFFGVGYIARKLGTDGFGIISFAAAIFGFLSLTVSAGFNDIGTREIVNHPQKVTDITANVIFFRLLLALLSFVLINIATTLWVGPPLTRTVILLTSLMLFPLALDTSWVYKGLARGHRISIALILGQVLQVGALILVVKSRDDIYYVPLAQFLGDFAAAGFLLFPLLRYGEFELDLRKGIRVFKNAWFWTISRILRALIYTFDVLLIGLLLSDRQVGLYTAPYRIGMMLIVLSATFQSIYLPAVVSAFAKDPRSAKAIVEKSMQLAAVAVLPLVFGGIVIAESLIAGLFGIEYIEGTFPFRIILISIGVVFLHGTTHNLMLAANRTKTEMKIFALAAAVNIIFNLIFIPSYGLTAAAFITLLTELTTLVMSLYVLGKDGIRLDFIRPLLKPLAASLLMVILLIWLKYDQLLWNLTIGGAVYTLALYLLGGIPGEVQIFIIRIKNLVNGLIVKLF